jgi:AraC-like DNA-binding protein
MPITSCLAVPSLRVLAWRCPGTTPSVAPAVECPDAPELFIARRGAHVRRMAASRELVADSSVIAWASAGESYRIAARSGGEERATVLLPGAALLDELAEGTRDTPRARTLARTVALTPRAVLAHDALVRASRVGDALRAHEAALVLVRHALVGPRPPTVRRPGPAARRAASAARLLLAARHAEPLTLTAIGAAVGLSAWQLSRAYRATFGLSVHAHLRDLRLDAALERMREGADGLSPVAAAVGFSSHSHFTSAFRARFGVTPSAHAVHGRAAAWRESPRCST